MDFSRRSKTYQQVNSKFNKQQPEIHPIPVSDVWKRIGIDLIGPFPETIRRNRCIITATDYYSKWPEAAAPPAVGVEDFLFSLFCYHKWPEIIQSDQGGGNSSTWYPGRGSSSLVSSNAHQQCIIPSLGLDELMNQALIRALIKLTSTLQEQWDLNIDSALYSYQISRQDSSKYSPYFLLYAIPGRQLTTRLLPTPKITNIPPNTKG